MPHMPDDDEGDIRADLLDVALAFVAAALIAPGVIWWIAKLAEIGCVTLEAFQ